jgi:predicted lipoprotein with Yx(FWY)xxD motif
MHNRYAIAAVLVMGCFTAATASAQGAPAHAGQTAKGAALVDGTGKTLYTYDKDSKGKSACNGKCADNWPALAADGAQSNGGWTVIKRDDGKQQWAFKNKPLYTFIKDMKPGDANGDGAGGGAWHIATP